MAHYGSGRRVVNRLSLLAGIALAVTAAGGIASGGETTAAGEAVERAVLAAVNDARQREGLTPLRHDGELAGIAREHSCAMARGRFFDHTTPDGIGMGDRVRQAGRRYASVAENIARIESADPGARAVAGWLKSPGHRKNIMTAGFTHSGVGACRAGRAVYFTQLFLRPR